MAGRLGYSGVLRHQASPLDERQLQTTDLYNNALRFFLEYVTSTYTNGAWVWLTSLSFSLSEFACGPVHFCSLLLSPCPPLVTKVSRGLWALGYLPVGIQVPWL